MAMSSLILSAAALWFSSFSFGVSADLGADATSCDFGSHPDYFGDGVFATCLLPLERVDPLEVTCPREIDGVEYRIYPENPTKYAYVYNKSGGGLNIGNFAFKEMALEKIFGKVSDEPIVTWKDGNNRTTLLIQYPKDGYLVRRLPFSILYFCKAENKRVDSLGFLAELRSLLNLRRDTFSSGRVLRIPALRRLEEVGYTGVFRLDLDALTLVTNGCGNVPTGLFNNVEMSNRLRRLNSCVVDVTSSPNVGFYCDGVVEPRTCFDDLIRLGDSTSAFRITRPPNRMRRHGKFYFVNYDGNFMRHAFSGKCNCRDPSTDVVTGTIVVKRQGISTCNVVELIAQVGDFYSDGDLCTAVLYPLDSYRIVFPKLNASFDVASKRFTSFDGKRLEIISALGIEDAQARLLQRINPLEPMAVIERDIEELFPNDSLRVEFDKDESTVTLYYRSQPEGMTEPIQLTYLWRQKAVGFKERVQMTATISVVLMPRPKP